METLLSSFGFKKKIPPPTTISITVDKSHLITIGEQLYTESIELIRELVNNAYDADARVAEVFISENTIRIQDDGNGMDLKGLKQYFNIGSNFKRQEKKSPVFARDRIGQFGIGKFASLSAASRFEVQTQRGDFSAKVVFDKQSWGENKTSWELPLEVGVANPAGGNGTTVTLYDLFKKFDLTEVEKRIQEGVPLKAPNFVVKLNGHQIMAKGYDGQLFPVLEGSSFGPIHGEIVILPLSQAGMEGAGIEIKVKQVTVTREFFGMEAWGSVLSRIRGEIHADFLPITSDRSGFIQDSPEYAEFFRVMQKVLHDLKKSLGKLLDKTEKRRATQALNDALERVYKALGMNPDFSPFGAVPQGGLSAKGGKKGAQELAEPDGQKSLLEAGQEETPGAEESPASEVPQEIEIPKKLTAPAKSLKKISPDAVVKKMRFGKMAISCCLDHFGTEGNECHTEGTVIFINRDHSLYQRATKKASTYTLHIARLLTQEIALMKDPRSPRQAFARQSKLLKDAFSDS